jgi:hypothetical protein
VTSGLRRATGWRACKCLIWTACVMIGLEPMSAHTGDTDRET